MGYKTKEVAKQEARTPAPIERTKSRRVFVPYVDIYEEGDETIILADMPGVDEKSIDIDLDKNVLTITGTVEPAQREGYRLAYAEYEVGDFQRSFTLSCPIDVNKTEAHITNGVLRLILPKAEEAKPRKISVKTA